MRQHIYDKTDIGTKAEQIIQQGDFVSDEIMIDLVNSQLEAIHDKSFLLDGFPRNVVQAQKLNELLVKRNWPLSLVINLDVPHDVILQRIIDRKLYTILNIRLDSCTIRKNVQFIIQSTCCSWKR